MKTKIIEKFEMFQDTPLEWSVKFSGVELTGWGRGPLLAFWDLFRKFVVGR